MLPMHAQFDDSGVGRGRACRTCLIRMESGRFKVFKHLNDWFDEFRLYHRKDGRVVKEDDDLMSRYALRGDDAALCAHGHSAQAAVDPAWPGGWMAA